MLVLHKDVLFHCNKVIVFVPDGDSTLALYCKHGQLPTLRVESRGLYHKTYFGRNLRFSVIVLGLGRSYQPSLLLVGKARSLLYSGVPERGVHMGRLLAVPTNTRLGWKGLPGTNTLAYF